MKLPFIQWGLGLVIYIALMALMMLVYCPKFYKVLRDRRKEKDDEE